MRVSDSENAETAQNGIHREIEVTAQSSPSSFLLPLQRRLLQGLSSWWGKINQRLPAGVRGGIIGVLITAVVVIASYRWISYLDSAIRSAIIAGLIPLIATILVALIKALIDRATIDPKLLDSIGAIIGSSVALLIALVVISLSPPSQGAEATSTPVPLPTAMPTSTWTPAPTTTYPSTLTPTPSEEVVKEFLITKEGEPTITVKPSERITATVQEIVQIKVEVSMTYEEQEKDILFTWYTCRTGTRLVLQRIGNPEMLYIAPGGLGADCIVVVVEKGGVLLDKDEIFVDVQE